MCIIIAKPAGVIVPSNEVLDRCAMLNRDGIGIAYTLDGMVKIKKDFADVDIFKAFLEATITKADACLIHFRIATAGVTDAGNCHPFPLSRRKKRLRALETITDMAVAHNGTLHDLSAHKKYSDTLLFIKDILSDPVVRNNLHSTAIQELITGYLDTSRLAILDRVGNILRFGTFHQEYGLYFSNMGYQSYQRDITYENSAWANRRQCIACFKFFDRTDMEKVTDYSHKCMPCMKASRLLLVNNRKGDDNA